MGMTEKPKIAIIGGGRSGGKMLKAQIEILEELESYRAIGTVGRFNELNERATAKPLVPVFNGYPGYCLCTDSRCPNCGEKMSWLFKRNYCPNCGQHLV